MRKSILARTFGVAAAFAVLFSAALPTSAGVDRAFRGHVVATIVAQAEEEDGVHLTVTGVGEATHLGNFTRVEDLVLVGPDISGTLVFTSHTGDEVWASVTGSFIGLGVAAGTCEITGGTGKYEGATGQYDFVAVAIAPGVFAITFDGRIDF